MRGQKWKLKELVHFRQKENYWKINQRLEHGNMSSVTLASELFGTFLPSLSSPSSVTRVLSYLGWEELFTQIVKTTTENRNN